MDSNHQYLNFIPGYIQGLVRVAISYPFDSLKVYMQKGIHRNTISTIHNILKSDPKILYRGSSVSFALIPIDRSLQFYLTEKLNNKKYNPYLISFGLSICSSIYSVPIQYICTNAILTDKNKYNNIFRFIKQQKIIDIYKGSSIEIMRMILGTTIYMGTYMHLRNQTDRQRHSIMAPYFGVIANIMSWLCMYPLDTIRTERQTSNERISKIIIDKYNTFGIKRFYLGITPVLLRTIPSAACGMFAYEYTRKKLNIDESLKI
jgi:hypothetical protein